MAPALKGKGRAAARRAEIALVDAADDAAAASDLMTLLYFAGLGMGQDHGAAVARGAMLAHDHLTTVRERIREARNDIRPSEHPAAPDGERAR